MKLLTRVLDRMLDVSYDIVDLTKHINQLARAVVGIAQAVHVHHQAISDLHAVQAQILTLIKGGVIDTQMTTEKKKEPADKPN